MKHIHFLFRSASPLLKNMETGGGSSLDQEQKKVEQIVNTIDKTKDFSTEAQQKLQAIEKKLKDPVFQATLKELHDPHKKQAVELFQGMEKKYHVVEEKIKKNATQRKELQEYVITELDTALKQIEHLESRPLETDPDKVLDMLIKEGKMKPEDKENIVKYNESLQSIDILEKRIRGLKDLRGQKYGVGIDLSTEIKKTEAELKSRQEKIAPYASRVLDGENEWYQSYMRTSHEYNGQIVRSPFTGMSVVWGTPGNVFTAKDLPRWHDTYSMNILKMLSAGVITGVAITAVGLNAPVTAVGIAGALLLESGLFTLVDKAESALLNAFEKIFGTQYAVHAYMETLEHEKSYTEVGVDFLKEWGFAAVNFGVGKAALALGIKFTDARTLASMTQEEIHTFASQVAGETKNATSTLGKDLSKQAQNLAKKAEGTSTATRTELMKDLFALAKKMKGARNKLESNVATPKPFPTKLKVTPTLTEAPVMGAKEVETLLSTLKGKLPAGEGIPHTSTLSAQIAKDSAFSKLGQEAQSAYVAFAFEYAGFVAFDAGNVTYQEWSTTGRLPSVETYMEVGAGALATLVGLKVGGYGMHKLPLLLRAPSLLKDIRSQLDLKDPATKNIYEHYTERYNDLRVLLDATINSHAPNVTEASKNALARYQAFVKDLAEFATGNNLQLAYEGAPAPQVKKTDVVKETKTPPSTKEKKKTEYDRVKAGIKVEKDTKKESLTATDNSIKGIPLELDNSNHTSSHISNTQSASFVGDSTKQTETVKDSIKNPKEPIQNYDDLIKELNNSLWDKDGNPSEFAKKSGVENEVLKIKELRKQSAESSHQEERMNSNKEVKQLIKFIRERQSSITTTINILHSFTVYIGAEMSIGRITVENFLTQALTFQGQTMVFLDHYRRLTTALPDGIKRDVDSAKDLFLSNIERNASLKGIGTDKKAHNVFRKQFMDVTPRAAKEMRSETREGFLLDIVNALEGVDLSIIKEKEGQLDFSEKKSEETIDKLVDTLLPLYEMNQDSYVHDTDVIVEKENRDPSKTQEQRRKDMKELLIMLLSQHVQNLKQNPKDTWSLLLLDALRFSSLNNNKMHSKYAGAIEVILSIKRFRNIAIQYKQNGKFKEVFSNENQKFFLHISHVNEKPSLEVMTIFQGLKRYSDEYVPSLYRKEFARLSENLLNTSVTDNYTQNRILEKMFTPKVPLKKGQVQMDVNNPFALIFKDIDKNIWKKISSSGSGGFSRSSDRTVQMLKTNTKIDEIDINIHELNHAKNILFNKHQLKEIISAEKDLDKMIIDVTQNIIPNIATSEYNTSLQNIDKSICIYMNKLLQKRAVDEMIAYNKSGLSSHTSSVLHLKENGLYNYTKNTFQNIFTWLDKYSIDNKDPARVAILQKYKVDLKNMVTTLERQYEKKVDTMWNIVVANPQLESVFLTQPPASWPKIIQDQQNKKIKYLDQIDASAFDMKTKINDKIFLIEKNKLQELQQGKIAVNEYKKMVDNRIKDLDQFLSQIQTINKDRNGIIRFLNKTFSANLSKEQLTFFLTYKKQKKKFNEKNQKEYGVPLNDLLKESTDPQILAKISNGYKCMSSCLDTTNILSFMKDRNISTPKELVDKFSEYQNNIKLSTMNESQRTNIDLFKKKLSDLTSEEGYRLLRLLTAWDKHTDTRDFSPQYQYIEIAMDFFMKVMNKKKIKEKDITLENKNQLIAEVQKELNMENIKQYTTLIDEYTSTGGSFPGRIDQLYFSGAEFKTVNDVAIFYQNVLYERGLLFAQKKYFDTNNTPDVSKFEAFLNNFESQKPGKNIAIPKITDLIVVPSYSAQRQNQ